MLSLGVQRMAKKNAIIRKLPAVETLGSATVICSDKTGTLTQNKMTVVEIASLQGIESEKKPFGNRLLEMAALCNNARMQEGGNEAIGEPTEKALMVAAYRNKIDKTTLERSKPRVKEIPFDSARKLMTTVHKLSDGKYLIITKGAFDVLIRHCTHVEKDGKVIPCMHKEQSQLDHICLSMSEKALRVLALAYKVTDRSINYLSDSFLESDLTFVGMLGMIDPPRIEVKEAVNVCKAAGITPIMITGDHVSTACAIGKTLGILPVGEEMIRAVSGEELNQMSDKELSQKIYQYRVFARVSPAHKVRIVKAFQKRGEVVAMTGDGVNDAPALKSADIGCAMGLSGTDVAKNAADMILADDNFATIVAAVKEGRGIYDNIRKSIHFLLSSNIGEIITIFIAILFGLPAPLVAVQLLWVNLVTDSLPAISLGVEPAPDDIMLKKPVSPKKGMFADGLIFKIIFEGGLIGSLALLAYVIGGQTMCFAVLSISQLFHALNMRSEHSLFRIGLFTNMKMVISFVVCVFMQVAVISIDALAQIFKVTPLSLQEWGIVFALSFVPIVVVEIQKLVSK